MWWDNVDTSELHKNTKKVKENNAKRWRRFDFWRALKERVALRWAEWEGRERAFCPSFPSLLLPCLYVDKVERRRPVSAAMSEKHVCFLSLLVCYSIVNTYIYFYRFPWGKIGQQLRRVVVLVLVKTLLTQNGSEWYFSIKLSKIELNIVNYDENEIYN